MNESSKKMGLYVLGGVVVLCLFITLGWFALHEEQSPLDQQPAKVEPAKQQVRQLPPAFDPVDDVSNETLTNQPDASASTNAAVTYRRAFDLFDALTKEQKDIVRDWRTNVDAAVEAELCDKLRPICELMHQASAVTNCDWGVDPKTFGPKLSDLNGARNAARAAIWSGAHCRSNDVTRATDDAVSALQLGRQISRSAVIGCLVDMAVQGITSSYVTQNLGLFRGANGVRLAAAFDDPAYQEAPSRAMEQEADSLDRLVKKLSSLPADEAEKELSGWYGMSDADPSKMSRDLVLAQFKQVADSERELAKALASRSEDGYQSWLQHSTELQTSNPLAKEMLSAYDVFVAKVWRNEVNRAMVVAGLAVAENGTEALEAHPDPASGKPFQYTKTDDGFELQSSYVDKFIDTPMNVRFK
jgi:hypothetical protein